MLSADAINERIRKYRTAEITLTVTDSDGNPLANTEVTVRMLRHKFLFGCNIFALKPDSTSAEDLAYGQRFAELLNFATLPFYWRSYEGSEGQTEASRIERMARWCRRHGIRTKGHPLVWTLEPSWLAGRPADEAERLLQGRITREMEHFRGLVDTWDVLNEAVVGPDQARARGARTVLGLYERLGRQELIQRVLGVARKANPEATLILNDFRTDEAYEVLVADALAAGVPIDVIGIQSHMHGGYWGAEKAWDVCQRFSRFGKPLHFTELTILSGGPVGQISWEGGRRNRWTTSEAHEERQAKFAAEFYSVLFSHPSVEAITWWDLSDAASWMRAPAGLIRQDMSPKPAYLALRKLVREDWWTPPLTLSTDRTGKVAFMGFLGEYIVEGPGGRGEARADSPGRQTLAVSLTSTP